MYGLVKKIVSGDVPEPLKGARVYSFDIGSMLAGTKYRGEFEERLKRVMKELKENRDIILFIDELHSIVGAGDAEGSCNDQPR